MRHLVIGQRQKAPNFSAFLGRHTVVLLPFGQPFVTTRVVHLPKRTESSLITESDQRRANLQPMQLCTVRTVWSDSDQAVRAVHSCKSWFRTREMTEILRYKYLFFERFIKLQSNFNGSNTFGTKKICSRQG